MDESLRQRFEAASQVESAKRAVTLAKVRATPFAQILARIARVETDPSLEEIIYCISERELLPDEAARLSGALGTLLDRADASIAAQKRVLERCVTRLGLALPQAGRVAIATNCLAHKRKARRDIGFRLLKGIEPSPTEVDFLLKCFADFADVRFLKRLLRLPLVLSESDLRRLWDAFRDDEYWQMRAVESVLRGGSFDPQLAQLNPKSFIWAVARRGMTEYLSHIRALFAAANNKIDLIGITIWAYGKLQAYSDIVALEQLVNDLEVEHGSEALELFLSEQRDSR